MNRCIYINMHDKGETIYIDSERGGLKVRRQTNAKGGVERPPKKKKASEPSLFGRRSRSMCRPFAL